MPTSEKVSRLLELIQLLNRATDKGTLPWEATPDEEEFRAFLSTGLVKIVKTSGLMPGPSGGLLVPLEEKYSVKILDSMNREIDFLVPTTEEEAEQLKELYWKIRRLVLHVDHLYGAFLNELKSRAGQ